ncbi:MAG: cell division protein ZapA [Muribaculaceae bacterium]|nr:cell division protein ZapA [Muribaculaceae bacterium]
MNDAMGAIEDKINITIRIADIKPIPLNINREDEAQYRETEKLVNTLWNKWMDRFKDSASSQEVMARVAFQFARLYAQAYNNNKAVVEFLADFEQKLDDIVVKV